MKTTDLSNQFAQSFVFFNGFDLGNGQKWAIGINNKGGDALLSDHSCNSEEHMHRAKERLTQDFSELLAIFEQRVRRNERNNIKSRKI